MDRIQIIQAFINSQQKAVNYLEIGVQKGVCFLQINAHKKIAVDPNFLISLKSKVVNYVKNTSNFNNSFFELTSDNFFEKNDAYLKEIGGLDVVFIDGLHTYEQSLTDTLNALKHLNDNGVILLHDCYPPHAAAALPAASIEQLKNEKPEGWTGEWTGDVWKTMVNLRALRPDLQVLVFDCDYGVGMVRKGKPETTLDLTFEDIEAMDYEDLEKDTTNLLNLTAPKLLNKVVGNVAVV